MRCVVASLPPLVMLGFYLALAGCRPPPPPPRPNVVIVTVDTLRADRLGVYGSETTRTPAIDRLAAEGLVFDDASAPLPETRPSHLTLFTSLVPSSHGVLSNAVSFPDGLTTLPTLFAAAGWETAGFAGCGLFDAAAGRSLGFSHFDPPAKPQRTADEVVPRALEWLDAREQTGSVAQTPFFLWLHLFDPHMPYLPPPPWNEAGSSAEMVKLLPRYSWPTMLSFAKRNDGDLPARVFRRALALYGAEVEYADHWLGRFFAELRRRRILDETVVLLTSDHGECFENGVFFDHSQCLGQGALTVPMILRYPRRVAPRRTSVAVEHVDVAPTLLRLADVPVPPELEGEGLLRRAAGTSQEVFFQQPLYRGVDLSDRQAVLDQLRSVAGEPTRTIRGDLRVGVRRGDWKYLWEGGEESLFHLAEDPGERLDRAADRPETLRELRNALRRFVRDHPVRFDPDDGYDPRLLEQLKILGYL